MNDKIEQLQNKANTYREILNSCRKAREMYNNKGNEEEAKEWAQYEDEWLTRWATLNRAVRFLKGEIEAEEL